MDLSRLFREVPVVSPQEARNAVETASAAPLLLDVREPAEFQSGHIPGALHIPLSSLADRAGEIDRNRPVVTY
jgi:rhodanese-related sulfurtransferase